MPFKNRFGRWLLPSLLGLAVAVAPSPALGATISHQLRPGDSLAQLASLVGYDTDLVAAMNNLSATAALPAQGVLYLPQQEQVVALADWGSLESIAVTFDVSVAELINYNDLGDVTELPADLMLELPPSADQETRAVLATASRQGGREVITPQPKEGPWQLPLEDYVITSPYGERHGEFHHGIDLAADSGTAIQAAKGGIVTFAGWKNDIYGYMVTLQHQNGYTSNYAHCSQVLATEGQRVQGGEEIALVGETGRATGPHLHFEIKLEGEIQDPNVFLNFEGEEDN